MKKITFKEISEKISQQDMEKIKQIVARAVKQYQEKANIELSEIDTIMDLVAVHGHCQKLDLDKLLAFDDFNFVHDITGINNYLDREKIELNNCFLPRCAR